MQQTQIKCVKYNYSLEKSVQTFTHWDGSLILSSDAKEITIKLQKPIEKNGSDSDDDDGGKEDSKLMDELDLEGDL